VTELLKTALPCGTPTAYVGQDEGSSAQRGVDVTGSVEVTDRAGVGSVSVSVLQHSQQQKWMLDCVKQGAQNNVTVCASTVTVDGTAIMVEEQPDKRPGGLVRTAMVLFADGHEVVVKARNMNEKFFQPASTPATREVPPLTLDQVRALAVDTPWPLTVSRDFVEHAKKDLAGYIDAPPSPLAGRTEQGSASGK
jgi:prepilin-type processing-associated H-X9-DG protein